MSIIRTVGRLTAVSLVVCCLALPAAADGLTRFKEAIKDAPPGALTFKSAKALGDNGFVLVESGNFQKMLGRFRLLRFPRRAAVYCFQNPPVSSDCPAGMKVFAREIYSVKLVFCFRGNLPPFLSAVGGFDNRIGGDVLRGNVLRVGWRHALGMRLLRTGFELVSTARSAGAARCLDAVDDGFAR